MNYEKLYYSCIPITVHILSKSLIETFFFFHNQGILSAAVLSVIPLIRPYQWQSLLMPVWILSFYFKMNVGFHIWISFLHLIVFDEHTFQVLPNDMLEFLDAPVPYIVSIQFLVREWYLLQVRQWLFISMLDLVIFIFSIKSMFSCLVHALAHLLLLLR